MKKLPMFTEKSLEPAALMESESRRNDADHKANRCGESRLQKQISGTGLNRKSRRKEGASVAQNGRGISKTFLFNKIPHAPFSLSDQDRYEPQPAPYFLSLHGCSNDDEDHNGQQVKKCCVRQLVFHISKGARG